MNDISDDKRQDAAEHIAHGDVRHALYHEQVQAHRRGDKPHFRHPHDEDAKPYGIDLHRLDQREKDGDGETAIAISAASDRDLPACDRLIGPAGRDPGGRPIPCGGAGPPVVN